ncbi:antibiotic biosynthesis monooxygenase family protein [Streptomyces naganishii]|uniref:Antibiotic biosynthesis monooxygenase n=1 Tax=Streptomyces naganishii JCM 4654 TaxID=1306179 RepID=A0A918Y8E9_9ACTN|nr:antibiotic biosynthesis monooxygenase family protein [Streptomyces naganishii]GHD93806.1 antibiotic biosynthesis monooxygenase [Streptomyces naganishii JCM 4654]
MAFRVMLRLEIEPGREAEFEQAWLAGTDAVTGHPANLGQSLSREPDGTYVIVSDWVDEPRFRQFEDSPAHLEHRATLHPFRKGGSFHVMEIRHAVEGRAAVGAR